VGGRVSNAKILQEKNGALLGEVKDLLNNNNNNNNFIYPGEKDRSVDQDID